MVRAQFFLERLVSKDTMNVARTRVLGAILIALKASISLVVAADQSKNTVSVRHVTYHGWPDASISSNGKVEVIIVPAVGRVMQFRFVGDEDGPFWENRALDGQAPDPKSSEWGNFGGDKTWPAPQADWPNITPRAWPPPPAFDSMPVEARVDSAVVTLVSPVDPYYGIRTYRRVELDAEKPVMTISTTYEKVEGEPKQVGVWVITQLKNPVLVCAPVPRPSLFPVGYNKQSDTLPVGLTIEDRLLSLKRDPKASHKIGMDAGALLWVGEKVMAGIESPRLADQDYPDHGSSAEIYTNPDPLPYVELEMLGPLRTMRVGDKIQRFSIYMLMRRTSPDPEQNARRILRLKKRSSGQSPPEKPRRIF